MKLFADTASLDEIAYSFSRGVNDGITTNPKIMESTGDLSKGFEQACKALLERYPSVPVSLETDLGGIDVNTLDSREEEVKEVLLRQAYQLASWGNNVVVKIPVCKGGLLATQELSRKGIQTNVTACMTPYQALAAANSGATYVSLFANRMLDSHLIELAGNNLEIISQGDEWKKIVKSEEVKKKYNELAWAKTLGEIAYVAEALENQPSQLIIGSIRSPQDITRIASAKPNIITIPTPIVRGLEDIAKIKHTERQVSPQNVEIGNSLYHPMTEYTLKEFEAAAQTYRGKQ